MRMTKRNKELLRLYQRERKDGKRASLALTCREDSPRMVTA